jgi:hypothetical protein
VRSRGKTHDSPAANLTAEGSMKRSIEEKVLYKRKRITFNKEGEYISNT